MAAAKKKTKMAAAKRPKQTTPVPRKLSNVLQLTRKACILLWSKKRTFLGIAAIYAALSLLFVNGVSSGVDIGTINEQVGNRFAGSLVAYVQLLTTSTSSPSQAAGVYQFFFGLFFSLALIWTLRQATAGNSVRVRDAFYQGMASIIQFILVLSVVALQLLPMAVGTAVYQLVVATGIAANTIEVTLWFMVALLGMAITIYLIASSLFGLLIVTLPGMTPLRALKLAKGLVHGRRWPVVRKLLFLPLTMLLFTTLLMLPVVAVVPFAAQPVLVILLPLLFILGYAYVYILYRELADD